MNKKQLQALIIAIPVIAIFGFYAYFKYLIAPLNDKHKKLESELETIRSEYTQSVGRAARLPRLEKEIAVLNIEIIELQKKLPLSKDVPALLRLLSDRMRYHGIQWKKLEPAEQTAKDYYIEHTYKIPFKAPFHNVARFLAEVGQMERIFSTRISSLKPEIDANEGVFVSGEILFLIYTSKP